MAIYPQHSLPFDQSSQLLLTSVSCFLTPTMMYLVLCNHPSPLSLPEQAESWVISPLCFPVSAHRSSVVCVLALISKHKRNLTELIQLPVQLYCILYNIKAKITDNIFHYFNPIFLSIFSVNSSLRYRLHLSLLLF